MGATPDDGRSGWHGARRSCWPAADGAENRRGSAVGGVEQLRVARGANRFHCAPCWRGCPTTCPAPACRATADEASREGQKLRTRWRRLPTLPEWSTQGWATALGHLESDDRRAWRTFGLQAHRGRVPSSCRPTRQFVESRCAVRGLVPQAAEPRDRAQRRRKLSGRQAARSVPPAVAPAPWHRGAADRTTTFGWHDLAVCRLGRGHREGPLGQSLSAPRRQEFLTFLNSVDAHRCPPPGRCTSSDNYGTHTVPKRPAGSRRPRYHLHFTPTSASCAESNRNGSFATITTQRDSARHF